MATWLVSSVHHGTRWTPGLMRTATLSCDHDIGAACHRLPPCSPARPGSQSESQGNLDLDLLRTFVQVAAKGSLAEAGARVQRSQSGVSQQMQRLEAIAGTVLFRKEGRNKQLTDGGRQLLRFAHELLALNDDALSTLLHITLPQIGPGLFAAAPFAFIVSFDNVGLSLFLTGPDRTGPDRTGIQHALSIVAIFLVERVFGLDRLMR